MLLRARSITTLCSDFPIMILVTLLAMLAVCACAEECLSPTEPALRFSAVSWRNASGHWTVQVTVRHIGAEPSTDPVPAASRWGYDIDFQRAQCGKRDMIETIVTASAPPRRVGSDYTFYPDVGFYKLHSTADTWYNAKKTCEEEGAHLCIINSKREEEVVKEILAPHAKATEWVHIGFHDIFKEGQYLTVFGEPLDTLAYTRWYSGQPNDHEKNQDCGGVRTSGELNDVSCDAKLYFLCEQMI